jgi:hypothetical protein
MWKVVALPVLTNWKLSEHKIGLCLLLSRLMLHGQHEVPRVGLSTFLVMVLLKLLHLLLLHLKTLALGVLLSSSNSLLLLALSALNALQSYSIQLVDAALPVEIFPLLGCKLRGRGLRRRSLQKLLIGQMKGFLASSVT